MKRTTAWGITSVGVGVSVRVECYYGVIIWSRFVIQFHCFLHIFPTTSTNKHTCIRILLLISPGACVDTPLSVVVVSVVVVNSCQQLSTRCVNSFPVSTEEESQFPLLHHWCATCVPSCCHFVFTLPSLHEIREITVVVIVVVIVIIIVGSKERSSSSSSSRSSTKAGS